MKGYKLNCFVFLLIISFLICCKKNKPEEKTVGNPKEVKGSWKWIFTALNYPDPQTGGPAKITPLSSGNSESIEFYANSE
jgi:hypothetical protein